MSFDDEKLAQLLNLGFDFQKCIEALTKYDDVQKATDWILSSSSSTSNDLSTFSFENSSNNNTIRDEYQDQQHIEKQRAETAKLVLSAKKLKLQERQARKNILEEYKQDRQHMKLLKPKINNTDSHQEKKKEGEGEEEEKEDGELQYNDTHKIALQQIQKDLIKQKKLDREARKKILDSIKCDKLEKQQKMNHSPSNNDTSSIKNDHPVSTSKPLSSSKSSTTALIQFKLSNGTTIRHTFDNTTTLGSLYEYVYQQESSLRQSIQKNQQLLLISAFPRRTFGQEETNMTVLEAGFVPNVSLNVSISPPSDQDDNNPNTTENIEIDQSNNDGWSDGYSEEDENEGDDGDENIANNDMEDNEIDQHPVIDPHRSRRRNNHQLSFARQTPVTQFNWNLNTGHRLSDEPTLNNDNITHSMDVDNDQSNESNEQRRENILTGIQNHISQVSTSSNVISSPSQINQPNKNQFSQNKYQIKKPNDTLSLKGLCLSLMGGIISSSSKDTNRLLKDLQYISQEVATLLIEKLISTRKLDRLTLSRLIRHCYLQSIILDSYVYATDSLVEEISHGKTLTKISLRGCDLITDAGIQHLEAMKYLEYLDISNCKITNKGFKSITKLKSLQYLNIAKTNINDQGFKWFTTNTECQSNLQTFILTGCKNITSNDIFILLKEFNQLNYLSLSSTKIGQQACMNLKPLANALKVLDVSHTDITDNDLIQLIGGFNQLKELKLGGCYSLSIKGLAQFARSLTNLEYIELPNREHEINGLLARLKDLPLKYLDLTGFLNVDNEGAKHISQMVNLKHLNLSRTKVTDEGMYFLKGLNHLEELYLDSTDITDHGLLQLSGLSKLSTLSLSRTGITNEGLIMMGNVEHTSFAPRLLTLNLGHCKGISNQGVKAVSNMINITNLNLDHTKVNFQCLHYLKDLEKLKPVRLLGINHQEEDIEMDIV